MQKAIVYCDLCGEEIPVAVKPKRYALMSTSYADTRMGTWKIDTCQKRQYAIDELIDRLSEAEEK